MNKEQIKELSEQSRRAFDFIQKLYHESSYMIREIEVALADEEEKFAICRPSGYAITAASSRGLEPQNVHLWLLRRFLVCFVPEDRTQMTGGVTKTEFKDDLKVLFFRIILDDKEIPPTVFAGALYDIVNKNSAWQKFENLMAHIEYRAAKVFKDVKKIDYKDAFTEFSGKLLGRELFTVNSSEDLQKKIISPALELYRSV